MITRLSVLLIILVAVAFFVKQADMSKIDCSENLDAPVRVTLSTPDPDLNTELSTADITRKFINYHGGRISGGGASFTPGVTEFMLDANFKFQFDEKMKTFTGQSCLIPEKLDLTLELKQKIYISRSTAADRCRFKVIMDHEMRHVHINRDTSKKNVMTFEEALKGGIRAFGRQEGFGPYDSSLSEQKKQTLRDYLNASLKIAMRDTEKEINKLQSRVDTPQEYMRIGRACRW